MAQAEFATGKAVRGDKLRAAVAHAVFVKECQNLLGEPPEVVRLRGLNQVVARGGQRLKGQRTGHTAMKNIAPAISAPSGIGDKKPNNRVVLEWVQEIGGLTEPENIFWCDGSERENAFLLEQAREQGVVLPLNPQKVPNSYLHRSNPNDVARVEQCTFICTPTKEEAGPTNNWAEPRRCMRKLHDCFKGAMRGRTMYVVPYLMGPPDSPLTKVGIRNHGLDLCRAEHANHDPHGNGRRRAARRRCRRNSTAACTHCSM